MKRPSAYLALTFAISLACGSGCSGPADPGNSPSGGSTGVSGGAPGASGGSTSGGSPIAGGTPSTSGGVVGQGGSVSTTGGAASGGSPGAGGVASGGAPSTNSGGSAAGGAGAAGSSGTGGSNGGAAPGTGGSSGGAAPGTGGVGAGGKASGTGGTAGGSTTGGSTTGGAGGASILDQTGNPIYDKLSPHTSWLSTSGDAAAMLAADKVLADNMITWQLPSGGFYKNAKTVYAAPWNGTAARSDWKGANDVELATIDNNATATELLFLADVYKRSGDAKYRDSARKALDFLLTMQYPSGGFPQVYPARVGTLYSNYVTFNDDAMARVLGILEQARQLKPPLDGDLFTAAQQGRIATAITKGVDYILKAQIAQGSVKTVWCAQHDPTTFEPKGARSYELPSKSGKESVAIVGFLMTQPQTSAIKSASQAAIAWFRSDSVKVANKAYVKRPSGNTDDTYNPIQSQSGSTMWYRFYDLDKDVGFFSGRLATDDPPGNGKQYDIMKIEAERRYGYEWGGSYGTKLLTYADRVGY